MQKAVSVSFSVPEIAAKNVNYIGSYKTVKAFEYQAQFGKGAQCRWFDAIGTHYLNLNLNLP